MENLGFNQDSSFTNATIVSAYSVKYPYFLSLIPIGDNKADAFGNTPPMYITINPNQRISIPLTLNNDGLFRFLYMKFSALARSGITGEFSGRTVGVGRPQTMQGYTGSFQNVSFLTFTLITQSIGARPIIQKLNPNTIQGEQGGMAMVRRAALNPQNSTIELIIESKASVPLYLNGFLFGYKYRI